MHQVTSNSVPVLSGRTVNDLTGSDIAGDSGLQRWSTLDISVAARDPAFHVQPALVGYYHPALAAAVASDPVARGALQRALGNPGMKDLVSPKKPRGRLATIPSLAGPVYCVFKAPVCEDAQDPDNLETATEWDAVHVFAPDREAALRRVFRKVVGRIFARPRLVMIEAQIRGCLAEIRRVKARQLPPTDPLD